MQNIIHEWNLLSEKIRGKYNIEIQIAESGAQKLLFSLNTPIEKKWFIETTKINFSESDENIFFEPDGDCAFLIENRHNPDLKNGFDIERISPPKESDRINFKKLEEDEKNFKPDDHEFFQVLKKNFSDQKIVIANKPATWKEFFTSNGYEVTVESLNDINGRFAKSKISFLTIQEKIKFWNSTLRKRYKFSDSKVNLYIFTKREKP